MRTASLGLLIGLSLAPHGCTRASAPTSTSASSASSAAAEGAPPSQATGPIRIEELEGTQPPMFVLRGAPVGSQKLVFLHGMCSHGLGSAQSFQRAAAERGTLIVPQADISCGDGHSARWSKDMDALDRRIQTTFRALGHAEPIRDIIVIGYSQGASRAESLARRFPDVYTRLVLMGGPYAADPHGLESLRAAVAMAGDRDRLDLMQASARSLAQAGVPATFLLIPEATHGSLGPHPEETMDEMLTWLSRNERPFATAKGGATKLP